MAVEMKQQPLLAPAVGAAQTEAHLSQFLQCGVGAETVARAWLPACVDARIRGTHTR